MAALPQKRRFALDSNVLIDLGERKPFAFAFLSAYRPQGLVVPPTVVQELTHLALELSHPATKFAFEALANMRQWDIYPYDLKSVGHGITDADARKLISSGLLPEGEFNDGLIIVETALACVPGLVTSDKHLLAVDNVKLIRALADIDLPPVRVYHPKDLLRALKSQ